MSKIKDKALKKRRLEYVGDSVDNSIVIGNYGVVRFSAKGSFDLSGIIYCMKNEIEFNVDGSGNISFLGSCKKLVINVADGNCTLDFSRVRVQELRCESLRGSVELVLGKVKRITRAFLDENAVLKLASRPFIFHSHVESNAKIVYSTMPAEVPTT